MLPEAKFIDLPRLLVADIGGNDVVGEDIAFQQKLMIRLERIQGLLKRSGCQWNVLIWAMLVSRIQAQLSRSLCAAAFQKAASFI
jgi:hypothetical protein